MKLLRRLHRLWLRFTCEHQWATTVRGELGVIYVHQTCVICGWQRGVSQL